MTDNELRTPEQVAKDLVRAWDDGEEEDAASGVGAPCGPGPATYFVDVIRERDREMLLAGWLEAAEFLEGSEGGWTAAPTTKVICADAIRAEARWLNYGVHEADPVARWVTVQAVEVTWLDHDGERQLLRSRAPFRCKVPAWVFRDDPKEE